jgi:O-antigen ligase
MNRHEIHNRVAYFSLILLSAAIPTYTIFINIGIIAIIANWFLEGRFKQKIQLLGQRPLVWLFVLLFLLHVVGLLNTSNTEEGLSNVGKKILLLAFPVILGSSSWDLDRFKMKNILLAFVFSCFAVSLFSFGVGVSKYLSEGTTDYLFFEMLMDKVGAQPIYFGMYLCFASAIVFWLLISFELKMIVRLSLVALNVFFILFSILLSARMSLGIIVLISLGGGYIYSRKANALKLFWALAAITIAGGVIILMSVPILTERVMELVNTKFYFSPEENNANGLTLRLVKWQCSIEGLLSHPLLGVGIGDTQDYLQECYKEKRFWGEVYRYNSHNQFFQTALGLGFVGLITLISIVVYQVRTAMKTKFYLLFVFVLMTSACFLTESVLERKQGIVFYCFFGVLMSFYPTKSKDTE